MVGEDNLGKVYLLKKQRNLQLKLRSSPRGRRKTLNGSKKDVKKLRLIGFIIVPGDNSMLDSGAEDTEPMV